MSGQIRVSACSGVWPDHRSSAGEEVFLTDRIYLSLQQFKWRLWQLLPQWQDAAPCTMPHEACCSPPLLKILSDKKKEEERDFIFWCDGCENEGVWHFFSLTQHLPLNFEISWQIEKERKKDEERSPDRLSERQTEWEDCCIGVEITLRGEMTKAYHCLEQHGG